MPKPASGDRATVAAIRAVLRLEARTLEDAAEAVGAPHARAVRLMKGCRGKVVVTGIGKSGLIAQKIAATLSSTGTPAVHLHPAEGLHGDLGVVQRGDVVLAVGKSGESAELLGILPALRKLRVKVVAITANPRSTLGRSADVVLTTPVEREACPLNLAPTASTTAALAVGDALAVALMKARGFDAHQFAQLHPGGALGRRLTLRVADLMRGGADNPVVRATADLDTVLKEITRKRAGAVSVVDGRRRLLGLITDYDIRRALQRGSDLRGLVARDLMNRAPLRIGSERMAVEAAEAMNRPGGPLNVLPVVDAAGRAVGMVQIHDLRALGL